MSLDTSPYRYEVMTDNKGLRTAMLQQENRILRDEMMAARENTVKNEADINLKSEWRESLEDAAQRKAITLNNKQFNSELILAQTGAIMVRKAALRKLLDFDHQSYESELNSMGKAFYIKRE